MTTRKDFIAAGTLAAALATTAAPASSAQGASSPKLDFDLASFVAQLGGPQPHKHLFAAIEINGGEIFGAMRNTLNAYRDIGVPWSQVLPVAVLYHSYAVLLGLDDAFWNQYVIPFARKLPYGSPGARQIATIHKEGMSGNGALTDLRKLVADAGARFFLCNNAARGFSSSIGSTLGLPPDPIYADLAKHLAPNTTLVPAGVWAVHAIQEQHFTLLQTSLLSEG